MNEGKRENALDRRIRRLVCIEKEEVQRKNDDVLRLHYIYDRRNKVPFRLFWILLLGMNFSLLFYQIYERIDYYLSEPVTVNTKIEKTVMTSVLPNLTLCSSVTTQSIKEFPTCINLWHLKHMVKASLNTSKVWELYDNIDDIEFIYKQINFYENVDDFPYFRVKKTPSSSLSKVYLSRGTCNSFKIGNQKDDFLKHFQIRMKYFAQCRKGYQRRSLYIHDEGFAAAYIPIQLHRRGKYHIVFNKLIQLQYVNRKRKPCVDKEMHDMCIQNCFTREYAFHNTSCRYPMEPPSMEIPFCPLGDIGEISDVIKKTIDFNLKICNCTRKCTHIASNENSIFEGESSKLIELTFEAPQIELFNEMLIYSEISLACDIGGLLGLFFGWSILSLIFLPVEWMQRKRKLKPSLKLHTKDLIKEKVKKFFHDELHRRKEWKGKIFKKSLNQHLFRNILNEMKGNICFVLILFLVTIPLLGKCMYSHFFSVPITLSVDLQINENMSPPVVTVCMDSDNMTHVKNEFSKQHNGTCDFTLLDMINYEFPKSSYIGYKGKIYKFPKSVFTLHELWNISFRSMKNLWPKSLEYEFVDKEGGRCTRLKHAISEFNSFWHIQMDDITFINSDCIHMTNKLYFSSEEDVDDVHTESIADFKLLTITTFMKLYKYLNTSKNVCYDNVTYKMCRENCRKTATEKLTCRLPYMMNLTNIPECSTTDSAYDSYYKYVKSMDKCFCERKCLQSKFDVIINEDEAGVNRFIDMSVSQTNNKVVVIEENFSYPFMKLLADVGNVLGITVGVSIMSLISYVVG